MLFLLFCVYFIDLRLTRTVLVGAFELNFLVKRLSRASNHQHKEERHDNIFSGFISFSVKSRWK